MTDEELERAAEAVLEATRQREETLRRWRALPLHVRRLEVAVDEGAEMVAAGIELDEIERRLFDGLPADVDHLLLLEFVNRRGPGRISFGTRALITAGVWAADQGAHAGRIAAERRVEDARRFGAAIAAHALAIAGIDEN